MSPSQPPAATGSDLSPAPIDAAHDFVLRVIDRAIAYRWTPAARAMAEGRVPSLTRRGWAIFYQYRRENRQVIDPRAVEVELARTSLAPAIPSPSPPPSEGMTIKEAAARLGVDRRTLSQHLVEIPPGPVPHLPPGKVPARRVGDQLRIFLDDIRGPSRPVGEHHDGNHSEAAPSPAPGTNWARSLDHLRRR